MNANKRMKYASTPTYGMQKRGFMKKAAPAQPSPTPDFLLAPSPNAGMAPFSQPAPFAGAPFPQQAGIPQLSAFPQNTPPISPIGGIPFLSQPFTTQGPSFPQAALPIPSVQQPMAPLVSNGQAGFTPRQQGFIPQVVQPPRQAPLQNNAFPGNFQPAMSASPASFPTMGPLGAQPYPAMTSAPFMAQTPAPAINAPVMGSVAMKPSPLPPSAQPMQQVPYAAQPSMPKLQQPIDRDKLWSGFLFGFLPILFIPSLFVSPALNFLRYAFITLCVMGLGAMWYRQMFTSSTRATVSIIYAALCIVAISTLLNGSADVRETSTSSLSAGIEATSAPDQALSYAPTVPAPEDAPEETPEPDTRASTSEAEQRLIDFMESWAASMGGVGPEMVTMVLPSWATQQENPSAELFKLLTNRTPVSYTIESISGTDQDNSRTVTMSAYINKNNDKDPVRYRFMIIMNKEGGEWYIDPNTLATNDVLPDEATENPNVTPKPTIAPRMTQTPVPDPGTMLYYNPEKGSFYHADQNCPRVDSKYLPLEGSFPYRDLKQFLKETKNLEPCLDCRAPTTPLDD